ncbi:MAG: hypothetical protein AAF961_06675, partial [Planctomycetota bacterium]
MKQPRDTLICCLLIAAAGMFVPDSLVVAEDPSSALNRSPHVDPAADEIAFRRVFVPTEINSELWRDGQRRIPTPRGEFWRLVEEARQQSRRRQPASTRVDLVELECQLTHHDQALEGEGVLDVQHAASTPKILEFDVVGLGLDEATWSDAAAEPVTVGLWRDRGSLSTRLGMLVGQSGRIRFRWGVPPEETTQDGAAFKIRLPSALQRRIAVSAPAEYSLTLANGRLLTSALREDGMLRRLFLLGPGDATLRVVRESAPAPDDAYDAISALRESYQLAPEGLAYELETTLFLGEQVTERRFLIDEELQITSAAVDGQTAPWDLQSAGRRGGAPKILTVRCAPAENPLRVRIQGAADLQLDQPWDLPRIKPLNSQWSEGAVSVEH